MKMFPRFRNSLVVGLLLASLYAEDRPRLVTEKELRAAATQKVEPEYPAVARQIRLTGEVELEIVVDQFGAVEKVNVMRGNTLLAAPSLQAIRRWKFKPFGSESEPSKASGPIKFSFQL